MKLNMWQWLGALLLIIAVGLYAYRNWGPTSTPAPTGSTPATTQPAR
jgi:hypothetical protein